MTIRVLISDLDGTLIPLSGNEQNRNDLHALREYLERHELILIYATGRHPASMQRAIDEFCLPTPDWAICDVGTTVLRHTEAGTLETVDAWHQQLHAQVNGFDVDRVCATLAHVAELRLQEDEKQGRFKLSFYTAATQLNSVVASMNRLLEQANAPWSIIQSVDPFTGDGLIDVLPQDVSKSAAIAWWAEARKLSHREVVYAGDSGNDLAALTAGCFAITVQNTAPDVVAAVRAAHEDTGHPSFHHHASAPATSGVLEGVMKFLRDSNSP